MYHIIVNPVSRSGRGMKIWKEVAEPAFQKDGAVYQAYFSQKAGDVAKLAAQITAAEEDCTLIILGGDGTFNEALQGIRDFSKVTLGYIPTGSSNDLARDLEVSKDPAQAVAQILHHGKIHAMDMGTVTYQDGTIRHFAVSCGIGFDAAVCEEAMNSKIKDFCNKIGLGKLTYLGIALKQLFTAKSVGCDITLRDKRTIHINRILFTACMNHRFEGGGFKFCPQAKDNDGILNLCVVGDVPKPVVLLALPTAFWGKHYMVKGITAYASDAIHIRTTAPLWVHTDGEVTRKSDDFHVTCHKKALRLIL